MNDTIRIDKGTGICLICILALIFVFGFLLNLLILIVYRPNTQYYASVFLIFSLAAGNCISSLVIPPTLIANVVLEYSSDNNQSTFFCGFTHFIRHFIAQIDIAILLLISFERYRKLKSMNGTKKINTNLAYNSKKALLCFCIASFIFSLFCFLFYEMNNSVCSHKRDDASFLAYSYILRMFILIGYLVMAFFYSKSYWIFCCKNNRIVGIQEISSINVGISRNAPLTSSSGAALMIMKKEWQVAKIFIRVIRLII